MTFGLQNAAQTFCFIDEVLRGFDYCYAYIDGILVASSSEEEHYAYLQELFKTLQSYGIVVNPAKCNFGVSQARFLSYLVNKQGTQPFPERALVIHELKHRRQHS